MTGTPLFDAAAGPLQKGVNMIEASAGTGKTFAIAMLVLRLVAEYGLKIDEILLVTFTRAATQELGNRIRSRLLEAGDFLDGKRSCGDETLQRWSEMLGEKQAVRQKIAEALLDIDRASIFTIHGFCQRMLQELAMESGEVFDLELLADGDEIRRRIADDFWRKKIYPLPLHQSTMILAQFASPEKLYSSVAPVPLHFQRLEPDFDDFAESQAGFDHCLQKLASWWQKNGEALFIRLESLVQAGKMKKGFAEDLGRWHQYLTEYLLGPGTQFPPHLQWLQRRGLAEQINGSKVRGAAAKEEMLDSLVLPDSEAAAFIDGCRRLMLHIRGDLLKTIRVESDRSLRRQSAITYDELILRLHRAVTLGDGGMAEKVRRRFKAVLIDEFQDTDALQWQIFSSVFGDGRCYCYLIGDPKQAIYRFRGADIHSYFQARWAADTLSTLGRNFRSHPGVVGGVNALFQARSRPFAFEEDILAFQAVKPAKAAVDGMLLDQGQAAPNMVYCQLQQCEESQNGRWSSSRAAAAVMRSAMEEIVGLLDGPVEVRGKQSTQPLRPHDIAILVRTNRQAEEYQQCLVEAGVPAVVSSRLSVYRTEECSHLLLLLEALARPEKLDLLKQALTLPWFGLTGDELYRIYSDEAEMNAYHDRFQNYAGAWRDRGVLAMMGRLVDGERLYADIAAKQRGERTIANIEHLLELLQQAESDNGYGPLQLIQWLRRRLEKGETEEELRLESDDDAVRIVTMHGAKGLEFPVVFCPLLWYRQMRLETERLRIACQEAEGLVIDLGSEEFESRREKALVDEMAEELRLAYVALTRSQIRCYVYWGDVAGRRGGPADSFDSSLGYLLFPEGPTSFAGQGQRLQELADGAEVVQRLCAGSGAVPAYSGMLSRDEGGCQLRQCSRLPLKAVRQMTSYSALVAGGIHSSAVAERAPFSSAEADKIIDFVDLPSGASFGSAVHDMFEELSFADLLHPRQHRSLLQEKCQTYGLELDMPLLERMLETVVRAPVGRCVGASFTLADLDDQRCLKEMGFYFHLAGGETGNLNALLAGEETVCPLAEKQLAGFLTGFIDLIFEHDGVYYIADYKSNNLGPQLDDYRGVSLLEAMAQHNYGLQLWLYALVLHRHLANFLPGYDHGRHFGGVFYLFVRGMEQWPAGVYHRKPDLDILERLDRCFGGKNR